LIITSLSMTVVDRPELVVHADDRRRADDAGRPRAADRESQYTQHSGRDFERRRGGHLPTQHALSSVARTLRVCGSIVSEVAEMFAETETHAP
jgi:hypothetical protein